MRGIANLEQKLKRVLNDLLQLLDPFATNSTVHNLVVEAASNDDLLVPLGEGALLGLNGDGDLADGTDGENTSLGRVDHSGEALNSRVHTHVADGESTALVLLGLELVVTGTLAKVTDLVGDAGQTQSVGTLDDGGDEAGRGGDSHADVGAVVLADDSLAVLLDPARVDLRNLQESSSAGLDEEVIDGELVLALGGSVQSLAQLHELADGKSSGDKVVRVLGHGLLETVGDDLAHAANREVLVGRGGGGAGLVLLNIFLGDNTATASALESLDRDTLLQGQSLSSRADRGLAVQGGLKLVSGVLGLNSGGLRRRGRGRSLSALGLLLLLSGRSGLVTAGVSQSEFCEWGNIGTLLDKNGNRLWITSEHVSFRRNSVGKDRRFSYSTDSDILLAGLLQNLSEDTLLLELEVHLCLIGLNLDQDITGLEAVASLLLPRTNVSRGHCRRKSRHANDGVGRECCVIAKVRQMAIVENCEGFDRSYTWRRRSGREQR